MTETRKMSPEMLATVAELSAQLGAKQERQGKGSKPAPFTRPLAEIIAEHRARGPLTLSPELAAHLGISNRTEEAA